jgi:hypothetical protein
VDLAINSMIIFHSSVYISLPEGSPYNVSGNIHKLWANAANILVHAIKIDNLILPSMVV